MHLLIKFKTTKKNSTPISMSKTNKQREEEMALSKNHGASVRFRKRLAEDEEAQQELEDALKELTEEQNRLGLYDDLR